MNTTRNRHIYIWSTLLLFSLICLSSSSANAEQGDDFTSMSIEELMNVSVYSVSKSKKRLKDSAAAIYVISSEDIRRIGATTVPEALRIVPGLQVARVSANTWAVSSRGFNTVFSNKLLVLVDGRSVYTHTFAGVLWDEQNVPLEDIERIEVIRGPGAALWGSNAVNGVINIITKHTKNSQGILVSALAGNSDEGKSYVRYGGELNNDWTYRTYGQGHLVDSYERESGDSNSDRLKDGRGGFRLDGKSGKDSFQISGDGYYVDTNQRISIPSFAPPFSSVTDEKVEDRGFNILGKWEREISERSEITAQAYYDRVDRTQIASDFEVHTLDFDLQHRWTGIEDLELIYGVRWRQIQDDTTSNKTYATTTRSERTLSLFSAFLQGSYHLSPKLLLTLGSKFEHNDFSGFEIQPSARISWSVDDDNTIWASVSRAVRTPSRADRDLLYDVSVIGEQDGLPVILQIQGTDEFDSEDLLALEMGYRADIISSLTVDVAGFLNIYDNLSYTTLGTPSPALSPTPHIIQPGLFDNIGEALVFGAETALVWEPHSAVRIHANYSVISADIDIDDNVSSLSDGNSEEDTIPLHTVSARAHFNLPYNLEFDAMYYYVDSIKNLGVGDYSKFDFRLGYQPCDRIELSFVLQNAFDSEHAEWADELGAPFFATVPRSFYGQIVWNY